MAWGRGRGIHEFLMIGLKLHWGQCAEDKDWL